MEQKDLWFSAPPENMWTIEHIIPQSAFKPYMGRIPRTFLKLNRVEACHRCNNAKGDMDPVDWARNLGPSAVARLAARFVEMGVPADYIELLPSGRSILNTVLENAA